MMSALANDTSPNLVALFERQVARTPDAVALIDGTVEISFRQLHAMAHHGAVRLQQAGIGSGDRVGHAFERSVEAIAALIAILKSGAANVPIAIDAPAARRDFMLCDSGAKLVICGTQAADTLTPCPVPVLSWAALTSGLHEGVEISPEANATPTSIAWVLYTSGSSGQPKGVLGTHRGCVTRIQALWAHQPFAKDERCFQHTAFTTVDSFWEILAPLCAGHALHVVGDAVIRDPERLLPHLAALGIQRICMVPSLLALLVDLFPSLQAVAPALKLWVVSGEPLTLDLCARFHAATRDARLINQYGLTESCADVTSYDTGAVGTMPVSAAFDTCRYAPIGRPFEGTTLYIVDKRLNPVPDGTAGELCIIGACLSDGYLNRPELMQERFFTLPAESGGPVRRALRTGDRVVRLPDGEVLYLGRIDSQINLRGYRIEPGEVEAALATHEAVVQAAVVLQEHDALRKHLLAFVSLRPALRAVMPADLPAALRHHLESRLPAYMLPGAFEIVDALPLTPSGKIDRQTLANLRPVPPVVAGAVSAEPGTESQVAEVFAAALELERVGATEDFFEIGGNSLIAMRAVSALRSRIGIDLPMSAVFEATTVRSLAERIDRLRDDHGPAVARIGARPAAALPVMSSSQERLWFFERLVPGTATYTISWNLRLRGELDRAALAQALDAIVRRHAVLRTHFSEQDGLGIQIVRDPVARELDTWNVTEGELAERLQACSERCFDLERGPLHHFTLFALAPDDHCLSLAIHHAVFDGSSVQLMAEELCTHYASLVQGQASPLPALAVQFADYAHWQREWPDAARTHALLDYWREQLRGAPSALELPTDRPRPAVASYRGAHRAFSLSAEASDALRGLARREGATLFMVLLAAFNVVLSRWSDQDDIVVGSPIAGRHQPETESMIGFFVNTLALRTDLSGDPSFSALLQRIRRTALGAYAHQDLPFEKLVETLQPVRDLSRQAIFQVMLALHPEPAPLSMPNLQLDARDGQSASAKFDLTFELVDAVGGIHGALEFATDLWDGGTAERFAKHVENILSCAARDPSIRISALTLMDETEIRALIDTGSEIHEPYTPDQSIAARFEAQVALTPQAPALSAEGTTLDYAELDARAGRLAAYLQDLGVGPDVLVGLCLPRSLDMVVGLLAILKAGGAYVPIDPHYPAERIAYMLTDSNARVLVTRAAIARHLPDSPAQRVLIDEDGLRIATATGTATRQGLDARHLAYVIYTSGTTGRPKGVMVQQCGLTNLMNWFVRDVGIGADDAVLLLSSHSFDLTQKNIFGPLITGGVLHLAAEPFEAHAIVQQVRREAIRFVNCTPSAFYALIEANDEQGLRSLRRVMLGGEPIQLAKLMQMPEPRPQFINSYGPTECSDVDVFHLLSHELPRYRAGVPLGHAVRNTQMYVLDQHCHPVPRGVAGELYIAGVGVARGYLNCPDLTAERFLPDPFGEGTRMYRTGDLVRWHADSGLEYLGRIDHQIKLRGFRIETGEIESALLECEPIQQALVVACDDPRGQLQLVAYVVGDGTPRDESGLRRHLEACLPKPMIPAAFVWLDRMPLSPNGKVDRKALPAPALPSRQTTYVAPRAGLEQSVAAIFADVLALERVGADDDFFHLGGHSLLAMRVIERLRKTLGHELPLQDLFEYPTAALVAGRLASPVKPDAAPAPALRRSDRGGAAPLSFAQERLWFLDRLGMGGITYNVPWSLRLEGSLDVQALELAIAEVLCRHASLRTRFADRDGKPEQIVDACRPFSLVVQRVRSERIEAVLQSLAERRFDLAAGPLARFDLLQTGATTFHLSCMVHHIVCDGWSIDLMAEELCALYAAFAQGKPAPLQPMTVQYTDYAHWQRAWLDETRVKDQLHYWREQLKGAPAALALPTDRPRPAEASYRGASVPFALSAEVTRALQELAHREGATLFMVLFAALNVVLARWSGQSDIVVGSPIAGRTERETEPMVGFFVNTLALRTDLSGDPSFLELLQRVRRTALDAYAHQELPFEKLVEALQPVRDLSRQAIFQVMLSLHTPKPLLAIAGLTLEAKVGRTPTAKFDLSIEASLQEGVLHASLEYASDLFDRATMERLVAHYQRVLSLALAQPACPIGQLPMLTPAECEQQFVAWNATRVGYPDAQQALHRLFERQVRLAPQAVALTYEGGQLSYDALNRRANQLAHYLRAEGVGSDSLVALCLHRGPEMVVALLGILKAGAAYVPLDPDHPGLRLAYMLADTAAPMLLTQRKLLGQLGEPTLPILCLDADAVLDAQPQHDPNLTIHPDQLAYCIYTSGSTGQPKGAMNSHRAIVNRLLWMQAQYPLDADDTVLQKTPYTFDVSVWEFFWPLITGARLAIARPDGHKDPRYLVQALQQHEITTTHFVPAMLQAFLAQSPAALPALRRVFASGEALPASVQREFHQHYPQVALHNLYGPTEAAVDVSHWSCVDGDEVVPIGRPVANTRLYLLDAALQPVPVGCSAEIYIAGVQLARGYLRRPDLTADRFVPDLYGEPGSRMYRTGDIGRYRSDGGIEYLGRTDHQVKLRGLRIELGEIENSLLAISAIREAAVLMRHDGDHAQLAAYVVQNGPSVDTDALRDQLRTRLPDYMVPTAWVVLPALPLNANGKIDRKALPEPQVRSEDRVHAEPRSDTEKLVADIWRKLFKLERVGLNDNFFTLGGHSMLAVQLLWLVEQRVGVHVPVRELFEAPTVLGLASRIDALRQEEASCAL